MKKLLSTKFSTSAFNTAILILRVGLGILMMHHGYDKLVHFGEYQSKFMSFLGIGSSASLALAVFAEFFCSLFLMIGLFTRLATIPLIITMCVALFKVLQFDVFDKGELAVVYLLGFIVLLFVGPGKISVDSMISK